MSLRAWSFHEVYTGYARQNRDFAKALAREVAIDATSSMEVCSLELCEAAAGRAQQRKDGIIRQLHVGEAAEYSRVMVRTLNKALSSHRVFSCEHRRATAWPRVHGARTYSLNAQQPH